MFHNEGMFLDNGGCGYVLKPLALRDPTVTREPNLPFEFLELSIITLNGAKLWTLAKETQLYFRFMILGLSSDTQMIRSDSVSSYHPGIKISLSSYPLFFTPIPPPYLWPYSSSTNSSLLVSIESDTFHCFQTTSTLR